MIAGHTPDRARFKDSRQQWKLARVDEAPLGMARFRPWVREHQEQSIQAGVRQLPQQETRILGPEAQIGRQLRRCLAAEGDQIRQHGADAVLEDLAGDQGRFRVGRCLGPRVLAPAESNLQPQRRRWEWKRRQWIGGVGLPEQQPGQGQVEQHFLARSQLVTAAAPVKPIRRWLYGRTVRQRLNADFRAGTRSVFSQVKVPFSRSGSRPKWP